MKKLLLLLLTVVVLSVSGCAQTNQRSEKVGGGCEDCNLMLEGMPQSLRWQTNIADQNEPGEALLISGIIYKPDGKTPAPGVILYVYHTDNTGNYSPSSDQKLGKRHGHLRGWMKTDAQGRYQFKTIRPASYPSRQAPQHIHPIIQESNNTLYWIDEYLFEDDPLLTAEERSRQEKRGGSGVIWLKKDEKGVLIGKRNIILGMNIPNY